ncbi:hypothetical protein AVEN_200544-1 [Araneus ventricosus]|uniref:Uncharacterized protein n=1 Tax=Araneus ventricosus TaxID=182803 RepID=A0A4Y2U409_ARAVE|nr:hypothetical protein AVEN_200544-1 [Araneus ventricosus]
MVSHKISLSFPDIHLFEFLPRHEGRRHAGSALMRTSETVSVKPVKCGGIRSGTSEAERSQHSFEGKICFCSRNLLEANVNKGLRALRPIFGFSRRMSRSHEWDGDRMRNTPPFMNRNR